MDKKLKVKWVKALRSGRYKQARKTLRTKSGAMCCLGVLCQIQGVDWSKVHDLVTEDLPIGFNAGLTKKQRARLALKNDGHKQEFSWQEPSEKRHSFAEIADYIEANL